MAKRRTKRRQPHGSAWHWNQTDCWYFTEHATKKRVPLLDENGKRIRGKENKCDAQKALARVKLAGELSPAAVSSSDEWTVARVCDTYLTDLHRSARRIDGKCAQGVLGALCPMGRRVQ